MKRQPTDTMLRAVTAYARKLITEEAAWHRKLGDQFEMAEELQELSESPAANIFAGLEKLSRARFVSGPRPGKPVGGSDE